MDFAVPKVLNDDNPILVILYSTKEPDVNSVFVAAFGEQMSKVRKAYKNVSVCSRATLATSDDYERDSFDHIVIAIDCQLPPLFADDLAKVYSLIRTQCKIILTSFQCDMEQVDIRKELRLCGFSEVTEQRDGPWLTVSAMKPNYAQGLSQPINLTLKDEISAEKVWRLSSQMVDEDLLDEEEVLTAEDYVKPEQKTLKVNACDDSASEDNKKKACKNCTCGFAERELPTERDLPVKSSCGSCYLGDAFRCSTCPYLGTPPFKPGENVQITTVDDI